jgi:hypothetical protein
MIVFMILGWFVFIILFALVFQASGLQEGLATLAFDNVKSSPSCCPSDFSTSDGCVCLSAAQLDAIHTRGGNNRC